jgi:hypothetical protein
MTWINSIRVHTYKPCFGRVSTSSTYQLNTSLEQLLILVEFVLRQRAPQDFAHFAFVAFGRLPVFEADFSNDVTDIVHDAFDEVEISVSGGMVDSAGYLPPDQ